MAQVRKPIPKTPAERVNDAIEPYDLAGYTKNAPYQQNRANKVSVKGSRTKDFSVKLIDIDTAVINHIENNIKPTVFQNTEVVAVPTIYAFPERWVAIQKDGYLRDKSGKILSPLIVVNRIDVVKNRNVGRNLDSNLAQNVHVFQKQYTEKNAYDRFDLLNNRVPVKEMAVVAHPDYITISYELNIYADYVEQLNRIQEAIQYAENSYWGDKNRYYFRVNIDSFPSVIQYGNAEERVASSKLNMTLHGYLIPDTINAFLSKDLSYISKGTVIFNESVVSSKTTSGKTTTVITNDNNPNRPSSGGGSSTTSETLKFLDINNQKPATATGDGVYTALLLNSSLIQPPSNSGLPSTTKYDVKIFVNGVHIDARFFTLDKVGNDINITFSNDIGNPLYTTDDILVVGKIS